MSKLATMAGIINDAEKKPQTLVKLRPPPGSRNYSSLSRSRSVTVGSSSGHPISRSKATKLVVDSLQRRNPLPDAGGVLKKNRSVRNRVKKSSKLRSIVSFVFAGHRRRRSSSLSSRLTLSTSSSRSSKVRSSIRRRNSSSPCEEDEIGGKYSSSISSSASSRASTGKKKKKEERESGDGGGSRGIIVNSGKCRGGRLSRGNSLPRHCVTEKGKEEEKGEERYELCKLRILMGGKCKPLNCSGKLRYDEEGVLVPDPLPP